MKILTDKTKYYTDRHHFLVFLFPSIEIGYDKDDETTFTICFLFWQFTIAFEWKEW